jgi:hypothetical protein
MQSEIAHLATANTSISLWYRQRKFVAEDIFPRVGVDDLMGRWPKFSKQAFRALLVSGAPGSSPRRFTLDQEPWGTYLAKADQIAVESPDLARNHTDNKAEWDMLHQDTAKGIIALNKELQAIGLINTTNISQNSTLTGTNKWSDYINSDPLTEIMTRIETIQQSIGVDSNDMELLLPRPVYRTLRRHPRIMEEIKYTQNLLGKPISGQNLADALEIRRIVVADNLKLTSAEGQTDVLAYNWGNIAMLYFHTGSPSRLTPNFGYTFWVTPDSYEIKRIRNEENDSDVFKSQEVRDMQITEPNAAYLWNTPI